MLRRTIHYGWKTLQVPFIEKKDLMDALEIHEMLKDSPFRVLDLADRLCSRSECSGVTCTECILYRKNRDEFNDLLASSFDKECYMDLKRDVPLNYLVYNKGNAYMAVENKRGDCLNCDFFAIPIEEGGMDLCLKVSCLPMGRKDGKKANFKFASQI